MPVGAWLRGVLCGCASWSRLTAFHWVSRRQQPEANGLSNHAKSVPALDAGRGLFRAKSPLPAAARVRSPSPPKIRSPVKVPERFKSPEPPPTRAGLVQNPQPTPAPRSEEEQSAAADASAADGDLPGTDARRKMVKVVRRVVRKVLPLEKSEAGAAVAMPTQASVPSPGSRPAPGAASFSFKHESIRTEDEVLPGLTSLMARGRTREPRPRPHRDQRQDKLELERMREKRADLEEEKEERHALQPSGPVTPEVPPPAATPTRSRPTSLPAVVGFLPPAKPATLAPPPGFIPAPKPATRKLAPPPQEPAPTSLPRPIQTPPPSSPAPPTRQSAVSQLEVEHAWRFITHANPGVSESHVTSSNSLSSVSISMRCATCNPRSGKAHLIVCSHHRGGAFCLSAQR